MQLLRSESAAFEPVKMGHFVAGKITTGLSRPRKAT